MSTIRYGVGWQFVIDARSQVFVQYLLATPYLVGCVHLSNLKRNVVCVRNMIPNVTHILYQCSGSLYNIPKANLRLNKIIYIRLDIGLSFLDYIFILYNHQIEHRFDFMFSCVIVLSILLSPEPLSFYCADACYGFQLTTLSVIV